MCVHCNVTLSWFTHDWSNNNVVLNNIKMTEVILLYNEYFSLILYVHFAANIPILLLKLNLYAHTFTCGRVFLSCGTMRLLFLPKCSAEVIVAGRAVDFPWTWKCIAWTFQYKVTVTIQRNSPFRSTLPPQVQKYWYIFDTLVSIW